MQQSIDNWITVKYLKKGLYRKITGKVTANTDKYYIILINDEESYTIKKEDIKSVRPAPILKDCEL